MNRCLEGLSNWQYIAFTASVLVLGLAIGGCVIRLATGHLDVHFVIGFGVIYTVLFSGMSAAKRWK